MTSAQNRKDCGLLPKRGSAVILLKDGLINEEVMLIGRKVQVPSSTVAQRIEHDMRRQK